MPVPNIMSETATTETGKNRFKIWSRQSNGIAGRLNRGMLRLSTIWEFAALEGRAYLKIYSKQLDGIAWQLNRGMQRGNISWAVASQKGKAYLRTPFKPCCGGIKLLSKVIWFPNST